MISFFASIFAWILSLTLSTVNEKIETSKLCTQQNQLRSCLYQGGPQSKTLLVYFHGFGGNEDGWRWQTVPKDINAYWEESGASKPHILSVSFRPSWWYTKKQQGQQIQQLIKKAEAQLGKITHRHYFGDSMGGHNLYRYFIDFPEGVDRLALICPAVPRGFYQSQTDERGFWPVNFSARLLLSEQYQESEFPMEQVLSSLSKLRTKTKVHMVITDRDMYGFDEGDRKLFQALKMASQQAELEVQSTAHCYIDPKKLSQFLL
jgi:pimeloyl-ACP methyl ester carboxylesterase